MAALIGRMAASRGGKPGKIRIGDVRHDAVLTSMPSARVIDRHVTGGGQSGVEQTIFLRTKGILVGAEQRIDGSAGDIDAPFSQQRLGDLAMMVLIQQIATQRRAKVVIRQMRRQLADQIIALRCQPAG